MKITKYRNASNRLFIEIDEYHEWKYFWLKRVIRKKFNLSKISKIYTDFDVKFQELQNKDGDVCIAWGIWEGFHLTALDEKSEGLVLEIMDFLKEKYSQTRKMGSAHHQ